MDPGMNQLLKWSVENSAASQPSTNPPSTPSPLRPLDAAALKVLMGGPSDADMMKESMAAIQDPSIGLSEKLVAFDNLEQLIESIDNANNLDFLGLWTPLVSLLGDPEEELRTMAAWCVGTAVQNNTKAQERALVVGAIPALVTMATQDPGQAARKKALYALSSELRNYQPAVEATVKALPKELKPDGIIDAGDMSAVDGLMDKMRGVTDGSQL